jgi:hypothetical protein
MLTPERPSSSTPRRTDGQITKPKRNRRIFSCFFCREKKLRCDRVQPTCGRCQNSGNVCDYAPTALRLEDLALEYFEKLHPVGLDDVPPKNDLLSDFASRAPESSPLRSQDISTTAPNEHGAGFLDSMLHAESALSLDRQFEFSPRPGCQSQTHHLEPPSPAAVTNHKHSESILYRSGTSKPRLHGASAAISVIHSTPVILKEVCYI